MERFVAGRAEISHVEQTSWRWHEEFYVHHMLGMRLRMKWAQETWVRNPFRLLCDQFCVDTADDLAHTLNTRMQIDSIVCIGFNLKVRRAYYGMVHERRPHKTSDGGALESNTAALSQYCDYL